MPLHELNLKETLDISYHYWLCILTACQGTSGNIMFNTFLSVHRGLYCHFLSGPMSFLGDLPPGEGILGVGCPRGGAGIGLLVLAFCHKWISGTSLLAYFPEGHLCQKATSRATLPQWTLLAYASYCNAFLKISQLEIIHLTFVYKKGIVPHQLFHWNSTCALSTKIDPWRAQILP